METSCDHSSLILPNDGSYAPLAGRYAADIARRFGFSEAETRAVSEAVAAAVTWVLAYSFEPLENARVEVSFERTPEGLQITLRDKGLPLAASDSRAEAPTSASGFTYHQLEALVDEVRLNNRGREGKEIVLVKHLKGQSVQAYVDACVLVPFADTDDAEPGETAEPACEVRALAAGEAAEVSKIIYRTYGYSYPNDYVYYPDRIAALNDGGRIHSAVAVAADGSVVGHCALQFSQAHPAIAELSQGAVAPGYRSRGCFTKLTDYLLGVARRQCLRGVFGQPVTIHTYSQATALQLGFKDCGLLLGLVPAATVFRGIAAPLDRRGTMMLQYMPLAPFPRQTLYLPRAHHRMARRIYDAWGHHPDIRDDTDAASPATSAPSSRFAVEMYPGLNFAVIRVTHYGQTSVEELKAVLKTLCLQKIDVIHLKLPLAEPRTAGLAPAMENLGFFFAGILPGGLPDSDALILQYLNNVAVDYEKIQAASEAGRNLVNYVMRQHRQR